MNQTPFGTRAGWNSNSVKIRNVASEASATPRRADHMSRVET